MVILIDPDREVVMVYRLDSDPVELGNEETLTIPELFPGWELPISELLPPVCEQDEIDKSNGNLVHESPEFCDQFPLFTR